jgi:hypothetical protein
VSHGVEDRGFSLRYEVSLAVDLPAIDENDEGVLAGGGEDDSGDVSAPVRQEKSRSRSAEILIGGRPRRASTSRTPKGSASLALGPRSASFRPPPTRGSRPPSGAPFGLPPRYELNEQGLALLALRATSEAPASSMSSSPDQRDGSALHRQGLGARRLRAPSEDSLSTAAGVEQFSGAASTESPATLCSVFGGSEWSEESEDPQEEAVEERGLEEQEGGQVGEEEAAVFENAQETVATK